jgi:hypothetical protein
LNLKNSAELRKIFLFRTDPKIHYSARDSSEPWPKRTTANSAGCSVEAVAAAVVVAVVAAGAAAGPA